MRRGDFSELLNPTNGFYTGARIINDPLTGQPFPGNVIPTEPPVAERHRVPEPVSAADARLPAGHANLRQSSDNPTDQRKDNLRIDYRLNASN